ncbi:hypothetical protein HDU98_005562 [Podochytrium sp. JEL0797]|nr:hypothetical protein HDU98_005562 [Podochytrium sp. JEL0797]
MLSLLVPALLLAQTSLAELSIAGCTNVETVITSFGFTTTPTAAVNPTYTGCGCQFAVNVPAGSAVTASCHLVASTGLWSIESLAISNPPITRGSFPALLVWATPAEGFAAAQTLSFTNNALTGNALSMGDHLPPLVSYIDVSNNPTLGQWPGVAANGQAPNYSVRAVFQTGNTNPCCPPAPLGATTAMSCLPAAAVCTAPFSGVVSANVVNPLAGAISAVSSVASLSTVTAASATLSTGSVATSGILSTGSLTASLTATTTALTTLTTVAPTTTLTLTLTTAIAFPTTTTAATTQSTAPIASSEPEILAPTESSSHNTLPGGSIAAICIGTFLLAGIVGFSTAGWYMRRNHTHMKIIEV